MKKVFNCFDVEKTGFVDAVLFPNILKQLGANVDKQEVLAKVEEIDPESELKYQWFTHCIGRPSFLAFLCPHFYNFFALILPTTCRVIKLYS